MMQWMVENWYLIVTGVVMIGLGILTVCDFLQLPRKSQIAKVKQWLIFAVVEAEKQLGSGTGQLKLRKVYDGFVERFPMIALHISFETFAAWVDEALQEMQNIIENNDKVKKYLVGDPYGIENQMGKSQ